MKIKKNRDFQLKVRYTPLFDRLRVTARGVISWKRLPPELILSARKGSLPGKDRRRKINYDSATQKFSDGTQLLRTNHTGRS